MKGKSQRLDIYLITLPIIRLSGFEGSDSSGTSQTDYSQFTNRSSKVACSLMFCQLNGIHNFLHKKDER